MYIIRRVANFKVEILGLFQRGRRRSGLVRAVVKNPSGGGTRGTIATLHAECDCAVACAATHSRDIAWRQRRERMLAAGRPGFVAWHCRARDSQVAHYMAAGIRCRRDERLDDSSAPPHG